MRLDKVSAILKLSKFQVSIILCLTVAYFAIFSQIVEFTDRALLASDTWSYQSIAVNFAKGYGFHRSGKIGPIKDYKFEDNYNPKYFNVFNTYTGIVDVHRNLGYPLFLSSIYRLFGISPIIAKHIQLLLLIIIASLLPLLGYVIWNNLGFLSGFIASPLFLIQNYRISEQIMSESLVIFTLFLMVASCIYCELRKTRKSEIILGLTFGIGLLVKGNLLFIPLLYFLFYLIRGNQNKESSGLKGFFIIAGFFLMPIIPWTLFVNIQNDLIKDKLKQVKEVVLSDEILRTEKGDILDKIYPQVGRGFLSKRELTFQEKRLLLDSICPEIKRNGFKLTDTSINPVIKLALLEKILAGSSFGFLRVLGRKYYALDFHNEYVTGDGGHAEWRINENSFYKNDKMGDVSSASRILNFYGHHPLLMFKLMWKNLNSGFSHFNYFWVILLLIITESAIHLSKKLIRRQWFEKALKILALPLILLPVYYPLSENSFIPISLLAIIALIAHWFSYKGMQITYSVPPIFLFVLINFVFFSIIAKGEPQWTQVMDFVIVLTAVYFLLQFLNVKSNLKQHLQFCLPFWRRNRTH